MQNIQSRTSKLSLLGFIVTLGIVYGDIGTSPLYVMRAIVSSNALIGENSSTIHLVDENFIIGALSCIIWTLTIQTTVKYVLISLKADNKGEGGILSLYSLVKKLKKKWLYVVAIAGAATLIADGVITPSLTVMSAIEGLQIYDPKTPVVTYTLLVLIVLFVIQQFGTNVIGRFFGPIMVLWFLMLAILGMANIPAHWAVFKAFNPYYAVELIINSFHNNTVHGVQTLVILGAVFLCTTGAEALYSDMGHCGRKNIQATWIFVKSCLILNYLGQSAWILTHNQEAVSGINPFYGSMPEWFLIIGVTMSTLAAIIASQALITGSFTIFSEAMSLDFWPRQKMIYPAQEKGQMYIPPINWALLFMCILVVIEFGESAKMEAAYGLSITITMLMTTILLTFYLKSKKTKWYFIILFSSIYFFIEGGFFYANAIKFHEGGWVTVCMAGVIAVMMYAWYNGRKLKNKYVQYVKVAPYLPIIQDMAKDEKIPKYSTNLVYISRAINTDEVEAKIIYSIINKQPKRADNYWFLKVENDSNPYTFEYNFTELIPNILYRVHFKLGFKVEPLINIYFAQVLEDLRSKGIFDALSRYPSLRKYDIPADFKYIIIDRVFNHDYLLSIKERFNLKLYNIIKYIGISDTAALGLETHNVLVEKVPMLTDIIYKTRIKQNKTLEK